MTLNETHNTDNNVFATKVQKSVVGFLNFRIKAKLANIDVKKHGIIVAFK